MMDLIPKPKLKNGTGIAPMPQARIAKIRELEQKVRELPQVAATTQHIIHGGMYVRTILVPANTVLVGALINVPTILIVQGDVTVAVNDGILRLTGYNVLPASSGRKQAFTAHSDTHLTMVFATEADTVDKAEEQFTDEADKLMSRQADAINHTNITGE